MQQQPPSSMKSPALFPPAPAATLSTEDVQKILEENKRLILAVMESQNLGKVAEAAQFRAQLQNNLWYLTAIADAQSQPPTTTSQSSQLSSFQEDNHNQQPHLLGLQQQLQQSNALPPRSPFERDQLHLLQQQQHYQAQQTTPGQLNANSNMHHQPMQPGFGMFGGGAEVRGNKLDFLEAGFGNSQRNSASGHGVGDIDSFF